jgi:hypothetical protein
MPRLRRPHISRAAGTAAVFVAVALLVGFGLTNLGLFAQPDWTKYWEASKDVIAEGSAEYVTTTVAFGQYRPERCEDGVMVHDDNGDNVSFEVINSVQRDGKCAEAEVRWKNSIFSPEAPQLQLEYADPTPADGSTIESDSMTVNVTWPDIRVAVVELKLGNESNSESMIVVDGTAWYTFRGLASGMYAFRALIEDSNGVVRASVWRIVTVTGAVQAPQENETLAVNETNETIPVNMTLNETTNETLVIPTNETLLPENESAENNQTAASEQPPALVANESNLTTTGSAVLPSTVVYHVYWGPKPHVQLSQINFVAPTPEDGAVLEQVSLFVNVTTDVDVNIALLEWSGPEDSGLEPMSGEGMNWWTNLTDLEPGLHTYRVLVNSTDGTLASSNRTVLLGAAAVPAVSPEGSIVFDKSIYQGPPGTTITAKVRVSNPTDHSLNLTMSTAFDSRLSMLQASEVIPLVEGQQAPEGAIIEPDPYAPDFLETTEIIENGTAENSTISTLGMATHTGEEEGKQVVSVKKPRQKLKAVVNKEINKEVDIHKQKNFAKLETKLKAPSDFVSPSYQTQLAAGEEKEYELTFVMPQAPGRGEFYFYALGDNYMAAVDPIWDSNWNYSQQYTFGESGGSYRNYEPVDVIMNFPPNQVANCTKELRVTYQLDNGQLAKSYNSYDDFSQVQGQNNWYYEYDCSVWGFNFGRMYWDTTNQRWQVTPGSCAGQGTGSNLYPYVSPVRTGFYAGTLVTDGLEDDTEYASRAMAHAWVAPFTASNIRVSGWARMIGGGANRPEVAVLRNSEIVWGPKILQRTLQETYWDLTLSVNKGDKIRVYFAGADGAVGGGSAAVWYNEILKDGRVIDTPSQVYNETIVNDSCRSANLVWQVNTPPSGNSAYTVWWGNPDAAYPNYVTDLNNSCGLTSCGVPSQWINNSWLGVSFDGTHGGLLNRTFWRFRSMDALSVNQIGPQHYNPDITAGVSYSVMYEPTPGWFIEKGPVFIRVYLNDRLCNLGCGANVGSGLVTYTFYSKVPWFRVQTNATLNTGLTASSIRDKEWVFPGLNFSNLVVRNLSGSQTAWGFTMPNIGAAVFTTRLPDNGSVPWVSLYRTAEPTASTTVLEIKTACGGTGMPSSACSRSFLSMSNVSNPNNYDAWARQFLLPGETRVLAAGSYWYSEAATLLSHGRNPTGQEVNERNNVTNMFRNPLNVSSATVGPPQVQVGAGWWDSNWRYRKEITVNNGLFSTLVNYQVNLTVDTASLISAGKMKADCSDMRFVNSSNMDMSYWIEGDCNSGATKVWVKVLTIRLRGTEDIYMYYGNPAAAPASDGDNTFIFFDHFDSPPSSLNTTKWPSTSTGGTFTQSVASSVLTQLANGGWAWVASSDWPTAWFVVERKLQVGSDYDALNGDRSRVGLPCTNTATDHGIFDDAGSPAIQMYWGGWTGVGVTLDTDLRMLQTVNGTTYSFRLENLATGVPIYGNSIAVSPTSPYNLTSRMGDSGSAVYRGAFRTDWVLVRAYALSAPTFTVASEETQKGAYSSSCSIDTDCQSTLCRPDQGGKAYCAIDNTSCVRSLGDGTVQQVASQSLFSSDTAGKDSSELRCRNGYWSNDPWSNPYGETSIAITSSNVTISNTTAQVKIPANVSLFRAEIGAIGGRANWRDELNYIGGSWYDHSPLDTVYTAVYCDEGYCYYGRHAGSYYKYRKGDGRSEISAVGGMGTWATSPSPQTDYIGAIYCDTLYCYAAHNGTAGDQGGNITKILKSNGTIMWGRGGGQPGIDVGWGSCPQHNLTAIWCDQSPAGACYIGTAGFWKVKKSDGVTVNPGPGALCINPAEPYYSDIWCDDNSCFAASAGGANPGYIVAWIKGALITDKPGGVFNSRPDANSTRAIWCDNTYCFGAHDGGNITKILRNGTIVWGLGKATPPNPRGAYTSIPRSMSCDDDYCYILYRDGIIIKMRKSDGRNEGTPGGTWGTSPPTSSTALDMWCDSDSCYTGSGNPGLGIGSVQKIRKHQPAVNISIDVGVNDKMDYSLPVSEVDQDNGAKFWTTYTAPPVVAQSWTAQSDYLTGIEFVVVTSSANLQVGILSENSSRPHTPALRSDIIAAPEASRNLLANITIPGAQLKNDSINRVTFAPAIPLARGARYTILLKSTGPAASLILGATSLTSSTYPFGNVSSSTDGITWSVERYDLWFRTLTGPVALTQDMGTKLAGDRTDLTSMLRTCSCLGCSLSGGVCTLTIAVNSTGGAITLDPTFEYTLPAGASCTDDRECTSNFCRIGPYGGAKYCAGSGSQCVNSSIIYTNRSEFSYNTTTAGDNGQRCVNGWWSEDPWSNNKSVIAVEDVVNMNVSQAAGYLTLPRYAQVPRANVSIAAAGAGLLNASGRGFTLRNYQNITTGNAVYDVLVDQNYIYLKVVRDTRVSDVLVYNKNTLDLVANRTAYEQFRPNAHNIAIDSSYLYVADADNFYNHYDLHIYSKNDWSLVRTIPSLTFSAPAADAEADYIDVDSDYLYVAVVSPLPRVLPQSYIVVYRKTDWQLVRNLTLNTSVTSLKVDKRNLYAGMGYGNVNVYNLTDFNNTRNLTVAANWKYIAAIAADENFLYAGAYDGQIHIYNLTDWSNTKNITVNDTYVGGPSDAFNDIRVDKNYLYASSGSTAASPDPKLLIYRKGTWDNVQNVTSYTRLEAPGGSVQICNVALDENLTYLVSGQTTFPLLAGDLEIYERQYPFNPSVNVGNDTTAEWNYTGEFTQSAGTVNLSISSALQSLASACTCQACSQVTVDGRSQCRIGVVMNVSLGGSLAMDLDLNYSVINTTLVDVTPDSPVVTDDLYCQFNVSDYDTSSVLANITWFRNGTANHTYDSNFVSCTVGQLCQSGTAVNQTKKFDTWTCQVTAFDLFGGISQLNGSETIAQNTAPYWDPYPVNVTGTRNINVTFDLNATDLDGDTITYGINDTSIVFDTVLGNGTKNYTVTGVYPIYVNATDGTSTIDFIFYITIVNSTGDPCQSNGDCVSGFCRHDWDWTGLKKICADSGNKCVHDNTTASYGNITSQANFTRNFTDADSTEFNSTNTPYRCIQGSWGEEPFASPYAKWTYSIANITPPGSGWNDSTRIEVPRNVSFSSATMEVSGYQSDEWSESTINAANATGDTAGDDIQVHITEYGGRLYAVWINMVPQTGPYNMSVSFAVSLDGGKTWINETKVHGSRYAFSGDVRFPSIIAVNYTHMYAFWNAAYWGNLNVSNSTNGGLNWSEQYTVFTHATDGNYKIAYANNTPYIYSEYGAAGIFSNTSNNGASFDPDHWTWLSNDGAWISMIALPNGTLYALSLLQTTPDLIWLNRSDNGGKTWYGVTTLPNVSRGSSYPYLGNRGNDTLFLVHNTNTTGGNGLGYLWVFHNSTDGGNTWSTGSYVGITYTSSQRTNAQILVDPNSTTVYLIWDEGSGLTQPYFAKSTDNGVTWGPPEKVGKAGNYYQSDRFSPTQYASIVDGRLVFVTSTYPGTSPLYQQPVAFQWSETLSYPSNVKVDVGNDGTFEYTNSSQLNDTVSPSNITFTSALNSLAQACTCTGCQLSGPNCSIPVNVSSQMPGKITLDNMLITFRTDTEPPVVLLNYPANNSQIAAGKGLRVNITDNIGVNRAWYNFNSIGNLTITSPYGNATYIINTYGALEGWNIVNVYASDDAGNVGSGLFQVYVNSTDWPSYRHFANTRTGATMLNGTMNAPRRKWDFSLTTTGGTGGGWPMMGELKSDPGYEVLLTNVTDIIMLNSTGNITEVINTGALGSAVGYDIADINDDGLNEIVVNTNNYTLAYTQNGTLMWSVFFNESYPNYGTLSSASVADLDGDGKVEIIRAQADGNLSVINYTGGIVWSFLYELPFGYGWGAWNMPSVGELSDDSGLEILMTAYNSGSNATVWLFNSTGGVKWKQYMTWNEEQDPYGPAIFAQAPPAVIADVNNDTKNEIVFTGTGFSISLGDLVGVFVLDRNGTGIWNRTYETDLFYGEYIAAPAVDNLYPEQNGLEIAIVHHVNHEPLVGYTGSLRILNSTGSTIANFSNFTWYTVWPPAISDINSDGQKEIIVTDFNSHVFAISRNGTELWNYTPPFDISSQSEPVIGDIDFDGQAEILQMSGSSPLFVLDSNAVPSVSSVSINATNNFTLDDLTCNGTYSDPDTDTEIGSTFRWFENVSTGFALISGQSGKTLDSNYTAENSRYMCEYTPNDGITTGTPVNSTSLQIVPLTTGATYGGTGGLGTGPFNELRGGNVSVGSGGKLILNDVLRVSFHNFTQALSNGNFTMRANVTTHYAAIASNSNLTLDAANAGHAVALKFLDVTDVAGLLEQSAGNLYAFGNAANRAVLTSDATGVPSNAWMFNHSSSGTIALNYTDVYYTGEIGLDCRIDIANTTFTTVSASRTLSLILPVIIDRFSNNTVGGSAEGLYSETTYTGFDNIVFTSLGVDVQANGSRLEFNNSNFDLVLPYNGGNIISNNHNDVANHYDIWATTLPKSAITNDFVTGKNVAIWRGTLVQDEAAAAFSMQINGSANLNITAGNTLKFDDTANAGFISASAGTLNVTGTLASPARITTAAVSIPTNYWNFTASAGGMSVISKFGNFSYYTSMATYGIVDIVNSTFNASRGNSGDYGVYIFSLPSTSLRFSNNTLSNHPNIALGFLRNFTGFDNIVITGSSTYDVMPGSNSLGEFNNSNFNPGKVWIIGGSGSNVISDNHDDIAKNYLVWATTLQTSRLVNSFASGDNVTVYTGTLWMDKNGQINTTKLMNSAILKINGGNTLNFDDTPGSGFPSGNSGTLEMNGTSAAYATVTSVSTSPSNRWDRDWSDVGSLGVIGYYGKLTNGGRIYTSGTVNITRFNFSDFGTHPLGSFAIGVSGVNAFINETNISNSEYNFFANTGSYRNITRLRSTGGSVADVTCYGNCELDNSTFTNAFVSTTGNIMSRDHNTTRNDYFMFLTSMAYVGIQKRFTATDNIYLNSGTLTIIAATAAARNLSITSGSIDIGTSIFGGNLTLTGNTSMSNSATIRLLNGSASNITIDGNNTQFTGRDTQIFKPWSASVADPSGRHNVSLWVNATNITVSNRFLQVNVSYTNSLLGGVIENTLRLWKYNGTWEQVPGSFVDTGRKVVSGNASGMFSIFAPLGELTSDQPVLQDVKVDDSLDNPADQLDLVAGTTRQVMCNATVVSRGGTSDFNSTSPAGRLYFSGGGTTNSCTSDNNNCYVNSSCGYLNVLNDTAQKAYCTWNVWYNAANSTSLGWTCNMTVTDAFGNTSFGTDTTDVNLLLAVGTPVLVPFGALVVGATSAQDVNASVQNFGNFQIDLQLNGTNMTCTGGGQIPRENLHYNCSATGFGQSYDTLMSPLYSAPTAGNCTDFNLNKNNTATVQPPIAPNRSLPWKIKIPTAVSGNCQGFIGVIAQAG